MNRRHHCALALAAIAVPAAGPGFAQQADPFAPLLSESRPLATRWQTDYSGAVELGLGLISDDSAMFGQYNALQDSGATLIGNLHWNQFQNAERYWRLEANDLGLDTREAGITFGSVDSFQLYANYDGQLQVRNRSASTPFRGDDQLYLPADWDSGLYTSDWANLEPALQHFERELERHRYTLGFEVRLNPQWELRSSAFYEEKEGAADLGGALFIDASAADATLLPAPVDYRTTEFDLALSYQGGKLSLDGELFYSDFDNRDQLLIWQNPYDSLGPDVRYPAGEGGLALAPDNSHLRGRLSGQYIFSPSARLQFDGSLGLTEQDQAFPGYSVNPALAISEPLPRDNLDGEVLSSTLDTKLLLRPRAGLAVELKYRARERDYDTPRDGYRAIPGDGGSQSRSALTVYNTSHDYLSQTLGFEVDYRLARHSKLSFEYAFENIERENAAVEETDEARAAVRYRFRPWAGFSTTVELGAANRAADTYRWDQSYYAFLDTELINATPDTQRYQNHPLMNQYYLSNRELWEGKLDLNYLPNEQWNLSVNLLLRDEDYDKSKLGLTRSRWGRFHVSGSYLPSSTVSVTAYAGYDRYQAEQSSRAFRGGQEKNAFEIYAPLPQASDPTRTWDIDATDTSLTLGANLNWQVLDALAVTLDYNYVDSSAEQDYRTRREDLVATDLPSVDTRLHHLQASGTWQLRDALSVRLDYQYYRYSSNDWSRNSVQPDTLGKVLTFGERNPNETIHYVGTSVIYRW